MKGYALLLFAALFILAASYSTVKGTQWSTSFGYKNQTDMKDNGWTLAGSDGITLNHPGVTMGAGSSVGVYHVPEGVFDWKVDVTGNWMGGSGHSYIDVQVYTERHTYLWVADGSRGQYVFYRDGVDTLHLDGYHEAANVNVAITMHKIGNTIALYCNSALLKNYAETDTQLSRVTGVSIGGPPIGSVKYVYAGGYVPTPSTDTGGSNAVSTDSNPNTVYPDGDVPTPPEPNQDASTPAKPDVSTTWVVVANPGTTTLGTKPPVVEHQQNTLFNGVGQTPGVGIYENVNLNQYIQQEHNLYNTGQIAPETYAGYHPYNDNPVDYYVTVNQHISGALNNPATVSIISVVITDGNGNIVYQNKITQALGTSTPNDIYLLGEKDANSYLQGIINSRK